MVLVVFFMLLHWGMGQALLWIYQSPFASLMRRAKENLRIPMACSTVSSPLGSGLAILYLTDILRKASIGP
jgi:hypothetical protein